jgi:hypothetical protein
LMTKDTNSNNDRQRSPTKPLATGSDPPSPLGRRRCGSRAPTRLQLLGLARVTLVPASGSASPRRDRRAAPGGPRHSPLGAPAIPCVSERASSEVPGCSHASCRSARGSSSLGRSLAFGRGYSPAIGLACDASVRRPLAAACQPLATARSRGGSPSTRTKARNAAGPWRQGAGRIRGVLVDGEAPTAKRIRARPFRSGGRILDHQSSRSVARFLPHVTGGGVPPE